MRKACQGILNSLELLFRFKNECLKYIQHNNFSSLPLTSEIIAQNIRILNNGNNACSPGAPSGAKSDDRDAYRSAEGKNVGPGEGFKPEFVSTFCSSDTLFLIS